MRTRPFRHLLIMPEPHPLKAAAEKTSSRLASLCSPGWLAAASSANRSARMGAAAQAACHQVMIRSRAARRSGSLGSRWRFSCWFTCRCAGIRFHKSSQGHADHGKQWSTSRLPCVSVRPLQTQERDVVPMRRIACSRARRTSRLGSDHVIAVASCALSRIRPCLSP